MEVTPLNCQAVVEFLSGAAIVAAAVTYLMKSLFAHWLSLDLEAHKVRLSAESETSLEKLKSNLQGEASHQLEKWKADVRIEGDRQVERLRADLRVTAHRRETTFASLQEKRFNITLELYQKLVQVERSFTSFMKPLQFSGEPPVDEKRRTAMEAFNAFVECYTWNRVLFPQEIVTSLTAIEEKHHDAWTHFTLWDPAWIEADPSLAKEASCERQKAWEAVSDDLPELRKRIEVGLQQLLGVIEANPG